ncbi:MAG TPA: glycogen debranching protein GlgX [Luteibacter sp.]|uniref:glycogen debranching protein GlgX n=1 Tax=Luteibacter sp. TaxID=1886636 RepID=UPI002BA08D81|nr:glycogen debranching protein GlgX [Luteibacter sp.]HVI56003.1 glycogen debranching protein GlgX [Luteibacter sp.]
MIGPPFTLTTGEAQPLGAHWDGRGVNMAVFSRHATRVEWCLFDETGEHELARLVLPARDGDIWHGYLEGASPGCVYGLRAFGPYAPHEGHRFNPHKLLIDPHARALLGHVTWNAAVFACANDQDSAAFVPKCIVVASLPPLSQRPPRPGTPWRDTVLYELHVKGYSHSHPDIPESLRGTVAALGEHCLIDHWKALGVTTIELMPMASFLDETDLVRHGLSDYWGYNPIAPLAIHAPYLSSGQAREMADTVDRLHEAEIEVIVDIVLNHTAEGGADGPTLSLRGLDNATYYQLQTGNAQEYVDDSGCGNTLDPNEPAVIALFHAALRYWACEIGVDGFRFDLATLLSRTETGSFDADAPLWRTIAADPDLRDLKLIAEPWDPSRHGSALGAFPAPVREWNGRYRDDVRRFWRGDASTRGGMATRLAGSSDIFGHGGRTPSFGINFITCHDGFTLADLTAYATKHNEANAYGNRDGTDCDWSANGGEEGDTDHRDLLVRRRRLRCAMLATLALSRGVPMLLAGDELSRTQRGNNNAFCQDNALSWVDWTARDDPLRDLRAFVTQAFAWRRQWRSPRMDAFFSGTAPSAHPDDKDIRWFEPSGTEVESTRWDDAGKLGLGALMTLHGPAAWDPERLFLAFNPTDAILSFRLPAPDGVQSWCTVLDADSVQQESASVHLAGADVCVPSGGLLVWVPHRLP